MLGFFGHVKNLFTEMHANLKYIYKYHLPWGNGQLKNKHLFI